MIRRIVRSRTSITALTALSALMLAGCAGTTPGTATGTTGQETTASNSDAAAAADPLAGVDPCALLDPAVISQNHLQRNASGTESGARYCRWGTGPVAGGGYSVTINIYDHAGLDQLNTTGFTITDHPVGNRQGRMSKQTPGSGCSVSIGVTSTSRVDVLGIDDAGKQERACVVATTVAPAVAQRLPSGSG